MARFSAYRVSEEMCGSEFHGRVGDVVAYLNDHGFTSVAVEYVLADEAGNEAEPDEDTWNAALDYAEKRRNG